MKKFFRKIGNAVKKGGAMINIPILKEEKRSLQEELQRIKGEYEEKVSMKKTNETIVKQLDTLIGHNTRHIEIFNRKNFADKESVINTLERAISDLRNEKQKVEASVNFDENHYIQEIKRLEDRLSKIGNDLTKFREIVKN
jgi:polyhydroxyalkanoate synthesis regulator phasin